MSSSTPDGPAPSPGGPPDRSPLIQVQNLHKSYGRTRAVEGVSFTVEPGEIRGFLGPNGAGKSTTIRMITGYLAADAGDVKVAGLDVATETLEARKRIGYLPESLPLYWEMQVDEYLQFMADSRGLEKKHGRERIDHVVDLLGLGRMRRRPTGSLSKGYRQRVGLAQAMLHDPEILILDEPTNGLDPHQIIEVRELLARLATDKAVLFSTHILQEISAICTRIMIISDGKLIADDTPDALAASADKSPVWQVVVSGSQSWEQGGLEGLGSLLDQHPHERGRLLRFSGAGEPNVTAIAKGVAAHDRKLLQVSEERRSLEQVYLTLTGNAGGGRG